MKNEFKNKTILITGGTGTIGSELTRQILKFNPKQVRILSRDDTKQHHLQEELGYPKNIRLLIGDIRDKDRLNLAFAGVDIIFHAAALKHVPLCEYNPFEAVKTNVLGSQNIIDTALAHNVQKVIAISTDKAAHPTNIMGTTKLLMEKIFINANYHQGNKKTKFSCVRFGNIAWARGSVLPSWNKQIEKEKKLYITNPAMTRFFMSTKQAVQLVLQSAQLMRGGEVFILKMPSSRLEDLAKIFLNKYHPEQKIRIHYVGSRSGERLHEYLTDPYETHNQVFENNKMIAVVPNLQIYNLEKTQKTYLGFKKLKTLKQYSSENHIDLTKIKKII